MSESTQKMCLVDAYKMKQSLSASTVIAIQHDINAGIHSCQMVIEHYKDTYTPQQIEEWNKELLFYQSLKKGFIDE